MKYDVLVAGEINPDLIMYGNINIQFNQRESLVEHAKLAVGSSSVIFASGLVKLGLKVTFLGLCGDDVFGKFMLSKMQKIGINTENVVIKKDQNTGFSVILNKKNDRAILTYPGLIPDLSCDLITRDLLLQARHLHVGSYFLQKNLHQNLAEVFTRAKNIGLTTSLDTNWDPSNNWKGIDKLLRNSSVFFPNANEALAITNSRNLNNALTKLSKLTEIVAVKMGKQGAVVKSGTLYYSQHAIKTDVIDTVGAGDNFDAGFIYGFLQNWEMSRCLKMGVICGSLSTRAVGGIDAQPSFDEAINFI